MDRDRGGERKGGGGGRSRLRDESVLHRTGEYPPLSSSLFLLRLLPLPIPLSLSLSLSPLSLALRLAAPPPIRDDLNREPVCPLCSSRPGVRPPERTDDFSATTLSLFSLPTRASRPVGARACVFYARLFTTPCVYTRRGVPVSPNPHHLVHSLLIDLILASLLSGPLLIVSRLRTSLSLSVSFLLLLLLLLYRSICLLLVPFFLFSSPNTTTTTTTTTTINNRPNRPTARTATIHHPPRLDTATPLPCTTLSLHSLPPPIQPPPRAHTYVLCPLSLSPSGSPSSRLASLVLFPSARTYTHASARARACTHTTATTTTDRHTPLYETREGAWPPRARVLHARARWTLPLFREAGNSFRSPSRSKLSLSLSVCTSLERWSRHAATPRTHRD